jgi:hypothetical protein
MSKKNITFYLLVASAVSQAIGTGLRSSINASEGISPRVYGIEVIMRSGMGLSMVSLMIMGRLEFQQNDQGIPQYAIYLNVLGVLAANATISKTVAIVGALTQLRTMGAVLGLGIASTALTNYMKSRLAAIVSPSQLHAIFESGEYNRRNALLWLIGDNRLKQQHVAYTDHVTGTAFD